MPGSRKHSACDPDQITIEMLETETESNQAGPTESLSDTEISAESRERDQAVRDLQGHPERLWEVLTLFQGCLFRTIKGLEFQYEIHGGEIRIDRKEKTVTRSTVEMAYRRALELDGNVTGPRKLGTFGASYLFPIFVRLGIIRNDAAEEPD